MRLSECDVRYINLDTALSNRIEMERQFGMLGMNKTERISASTLSDVDNLTSMHCSQAKRLY
jgi:hypothetical protein